MEFSLSDLRLHRIEAEKLLSPRDATLESVRVKLNIALLAVGATLCFALHASQEAVVAAVVAGLFVATIDAVGNRGLGEALLLDTVGRLTSVSYANRVARHEAGHMLVAVMVGIAPRSYTLSVADALKRGMQAGFQAGTQFCSAAFEAEVKSGKLSAASLDSFCCVALAGVSAEYLTYGQAEGGLNDIQQLDSLLTALGFTQKRADSQVRWALLSAVGLLRRHARAHDALTAAMSEGRSLGACLEVLQSALVGELSGERRDAVVVAGTSD